MMCTVTHDQLRSLLVAATLLERAARHDTVEHYRKSLERIVTDLLDLRHDLQQYTTFQN
jgi:hypothetical protein